MTFTRDLVSYPDPVLYEGTLRLVQLSDIDWRPIYNPLPGVPSNVLGSTTIGGVQVLEREREFLIDNLLV